MSSYLEPSKLTIVCWAAGHSACGGGQSGEHLVSKGVLNQATIFVQGFSWCAEQEKEIGVNTATANILCRHHNSRLSPLDDAATAAIRAFEADAPCAHPPINGQLFERWLLKTAINLNFEGSLYLGAGIAQSQLGQPSSELLDVVFGDKPFPDCMGAYFLFPRGEARYRGGESRIQPTIRQQHIGGVFFRLRGIDLFLSLFRGAIPPPLREIGFGDQELEPILDAIPTYHPNELIVSTNQGPPRTISIQWVASQLTMRCSAVGSSLG